MRQTSPARVTFTYQHQASPQAYSPKLKHSGFVLGQPSPSRARATTAYEHGTTQPLTKPYQAPQPTSFPPPVRYSAPSPQNNTVTVSRLEYVTLLQKYELLQAQHAQLTKSYNLLQQQQRGQPRQTAPDIQALIEHCKQNVLAECKLLVDRAHLERKEHELNISMTAPSHR